MFWQGRVRLLFLLRITVVFFFICFSLVGIINAATISWNEKKGKHFIIYFADDKDSLWTGKVLTEAENYYKKIAARLGYTRYQNFWTWDERSKIFIFPDKKTFVEQTGVPLWSKGSALRDQNFLQTRIIVTFKQEERFLSDVLPHEIGHLILRDFIGFDKEIPLWFEEGVAQLQERDKIEFVQRIMRLIVEQNLYVPIASFNTVDIREETNPIKVAIFYAQSISILDFLIKRYGSRNFRRLCRNLKAGKSFEEGFRDAYSPSIKNLNRLEDKWLQYMRN